MESPLAAATSLWRLMKLPEHVLANLQLSSIAQADLAVNSSFKLGHAAQTSIGLSSLSAVYLESLRGMSPVRKVTVNPRNACIAFHGVAYYTVNGQIPEDKSWDSIAGLYSTSGGGHIRIHTNFPHHRRGICDLLNLDPGPETTRQAVAQSLSLVDAHDFEERASQSHMCAFSKRTYKEWQMHPQAQALEDTPPVEIIKLRDDPPATQLSNVSKASDPLADVRILDLSRIIAAPVAGRTLAEYGAEVLLVTSPKLPDLPFLDIETSRYKRATQLDLTLENERSRLANLVQGCDVFLQAYRPGGLEEKGFGVQDILRLKEGKSVVCANLRAWGWYGPWANRRGFDSLVQTATGFNQDEGEAYAAFLRSKNLEQVGDGTTSEVGVEPRPFPFQAIDYTAGHLLAYGINAALCRMITEGGSYEVRVSLAAIGQWIRSLGRVDPAVAFGDASPLPARTSEEVKALQGTFISRKTSSIQMQALRRIADLEPDIVWSKVDVAPMRLDADEAHWD